MMKRKLFFLFAITCISAFGNMIMAQDAALRWQDLRACGLSIMATRSDGALFGWGDTGDGQLGNGQSGMGEECNAPTRVGIDKDWAVVSPGAGYTLAVKTDGSLWSWGWNSSYETGQPEPDIAASPRRVDLENDWARVFASYKCISFALKKDNTLWGWGENLAGTINASSEAGVKYPMQVSKATDWLDIAVGEAHVLALKKDGSLWGWGSNELGQLAAGADVKTVKVTEARKLSEDKDWVCIFAHDNKSFAIKADGRLYYWGTGEGAFCAFGDGETHTIKDMHLFDMLPGRKIISVCAGKNTTSVLNTDATGNDVKVHIWGKNIYGSLARDTDPTGNPISVSSMPLEVIFPESVTITRIACTDISSAVLTGDGRILTWGCNQDGELGIGRGFLGLFGSPVPLFVNCPGSTQGLEGISPIDTKPIRYINGELHLANFLAAGFSRLSIHDLSGKLIYSTQTYTATLRPESLPAGTYMVNVLSGGVLHGEKFLIP